MTLDLSTYNYVIADLTLFLMMKLTHFSSSDCDGVEVGMETKYWRGCVCLIIGVVCVMCGWWALLLFPVLLYMLSRVRVSGNYSVRISPVIYCM